MNEGTPVSIIEAMALGAVPVVHNSGGPREFVPCDQRFSTVAEAAELINNIMNNWSSRLSLKNMEKAQLFSEDRFSKQFIDIFNSYFKI